MCVKERATRQCDVIFVNYLVYERVLVCVFICVCVCLNVQTEILCVYVSECLKRDVKDHFTHPNRVFIVRRKMLTLHIWENVEVTLDLFVRRRKEGDTFPMP